LTAGAAAYAAPEKFILDEKQTYVGFSVSFLF
jgi:hypothetical protein